MDGETVQVLVAASGTDAYGNTTTDWGGASSRDVETLAPPEPRPTDEAVTDARNAVVSGWTLYLPADDPVTARDRVRVRGQDYPVQGTPQHWPVGVVVQAYRTEG